MAWDPDLPMPRYPHTVLPTDEEWVGILRRMGWHKTAERMEGYIAQKGLGTAATEVVETGTATVGTEAVPVVAETALAAGLEEGATVGLTVGVAGGFEIPVWGWVATGLAAAGGIAYGVYKHYQHNGERNVAPKKGERRHFNKARLLEAQHLAAGTATVGEVQDVQRELKAEGFDIGKYGAQRDGVDGIAGRHTRAALAAAAKRLDDPSSAL